MSRAGNAEPSTAQIPRRVTRSNTINSIRFSLLTDGTLARRLQRREGPPMHGGHQSTTDRRAGTSGEQLQSLQESGGRSDPTTTPHPTGDSGELLTS